MRDANHRTYALAPINEQLQEAGRPTIDAADLRTAMQDAVATSLRRGTLDWEVFRRSLATNTALSVQDVSEIVAGSRQRLMEAAEQATQVTARTFWGMFFVLLASLIEAEAPARPGSGRSNRDAAADERRSVLGAVRGAVLLWAS